MIDLGQLLHRLAGIEQDHLTQLAQLAFPLFGGGGGGGGTPGGSDRQIQFNNSGAFGGSADLVFNAIGSNPATGAALIVGANADPFGYYWANVKTQADIIASPSGYQDYYIRRGILSFTGVGAINNDLYGDYVWLGLKAGQSSNGILAADFNSVISGDGATASYMLGADFTVAISGTGADGGVVHGFRSNILLNSGGSSMTSGVGVESGLDIEGAVSGNVSYFKGRADNPGGWTPITGSLYGVWIPDITQGTVENYAWKSGAGIFEIGGSGKAAGIHVAGVGAFNVDGFTSKAQIWSDLDSDTTSNLALGNRTAGLAHPTTFVVRNSGNLNIFPDDGNVGSLNWVIADSRWELNGNAQLGQIQADRVNFVAGNGGAAPTPATIVLPTSVYGGSAQLLGGPAGWIDVQVAGVARKVPVY